MKFSRYQYLTARILTPNAEGMPQEHHADIQAHEVASLPLAFVGDAVFHLFVRAKLLHYDQTNIQMLSALASEIVSARWQSEAYAAIEPTLTEAEQEIFRRARNAKSHAPRKATVAEYHRSTGFEALLGFLYLERREGRLQEICEASFRYILQNLVKQKVKPPEKTTEVPARKNTAEEGNADFGC